LKLKHIEKQNNNRNGIDNALFPIAKKQSKEAE
jgi:hypothetical protein